MAEQNSKQSFPWKFFWAEFLGTGLLLLIGLSIVICMFGAGSPVAEYIPSVIQRKFITGFLFGGTGALIAISPLGKASGAHINPVVTQAFLLMKKIKPREGSAYVLGQFAGAVAGSLPLLAWGQMGRSVSFGVTIPGAGYSLGAALSGEIVTTFSMVTLLGVFLAFRVLRPYTPAIFPVLYSIMNVLESKVSGLSTNPARSLGPALLAGEWNSWWIYWIGPAAGSFLATLCLSFIAKRITVAKIYHFDSEVDHFFRRKKLLSEKQETGKLDVTTEDHRG